MLLRAEPEAGQSSNDVSSSSSSDLDLTSVSFESEDDKKEAVGNLVADDEWMGLSMELGELVRLAVVEDLKRNAREFLGKDEYKIGDVSKEIDARVKEEVARFRGYVMEGGMVGFLFRRVLSLISTLSLNRSSSLHSF